MKQLGRLWLSLRSHSAKAREKAANPAHVTAVLVSKARDQVCLLYASASREDQEHRRRSKRRQPSSKSKAEACAEEENPRVHRVPHVAVRTVIDEIRIPAHLHRVR